MGVTGTSVGDSTGRGDGGGGDVLGGGVLFVAFRRRLSGGGAGLGAGSVTPAGMRKTATSDTLTLDGVVRWTTYRLRTTSAQGFARASMVGLRALCVSVSVSPTR